MDAYWKQRWKFQSVEEKKQRIEMFWRLTKCLIFCMHSFTRIVPFYNAIDYLLRIYMNADFIYYYYYFIRFKPE
jgi:hypothetical protein